MTRDELQLLFLEYSHHIGRLERMLDQKQLFNGPELKRIQNALFSLKYKYSELQEALRVSDKKIFLEELIKIEALINE